MRRRRLLIFLLAGAGAAVVVFLAWPRQREPEYHGRTLSEWAFLVTGPYPYHDGAFPKKPAAEEAIRHIGTNALPWLLTWIQYDHPEREPPAWMQRLCALANKLLPGLGLRDRARDHFAAARWCFRVLGPRASPAIPELVRLMNDPQSPFVPGMAAYALADIGKDALPPLLAVLNNEQAPNRAAAAFALGSMPDLGTNAYDAVPALLRCLDDPDAYVAAGSASALGNLALEPRLVVPALVKKLHHSNAFVRSYAVLSISRFGDQGRAAAPELRKALDDPDPSVRYAAANALRQIAPEALP